MDLWGIFAGISIPCFLVRPSEENRVTNYINKIDRTTVGWVGTAETTGSWNKAALTTSLCRFIEFFCDQYDLNNSGDERLRLIATWSRTSNFCGLKP